MAIPFRTLLLPVLAWLGLSSAHAAADRVTVAVGKATIEQSLNTLAATGGFNQLGNEYGVGYSVVISDFGLETSPADQKVYASFNMKISAEWDWTAFTYNKSYTYRIRVVAALQDAQPSAPTGSGLTLCFRPDALRETYCQSGSSWVKCAAAAAIDSEISKAVAGMACVNLAALGTALPDLDRSWITADHAPRIETDKLTFGYTIRPKRSRACIPCIINTLLLN